MLRKLLEPMPVWAKLSMAASSSRSRCSNASPAGRPGVRGWIMADFAMAKWVDLFKYPFN
jgi:hypothetical protein